MQKNPEIWLVQERCMEKVRHTPVALVLWREAYSGDRQQLQVKQYRQAHMNRQQ